MASQPSGHSLAPMHEPRTAQLGLATARRPVPGRAREVGAVVAWAAIIVAAIVWGKALNDSGARIGLHAPPLVGYWEPHVSPWIFPALVVAAAIVLAAPGLALALRWKTLLLASASSAAAWAVALTAVRGPDSILEPVRWPTEYLGQVDRVGDPGAFLTGFTSNLSTYSVHVSGHPPGMVLLLAGLDRVGLPGAVPAAALMILAGVLAIPAVLLALREVAGAAPARAAAPFLVLSPAAVWVATSADALFAGVGAWSIALIILATGRTGRRADGLAVGGGLLFGATLMLSYGLVLLAVIPLGVIVTRRSVRVALLSTAGAVAVLAGFLAAGFWWLDGFFATREQYLAGIASDRPFDFFLVSNLAAFGLALGPAIILALTRVREPKVWLLVGGGIAAAMLAELSGMSKGEVERIWLPFAPWILLAGCSLAGRGHALRPWLGVQALTGLVIVLTVHTHW